MPPRPRPRDGSMPLAELAREVVSIPTASFKEARVYEYLRRFAEERGLAYAEDATGNAFIEYRGRAGRGARPLVLGAHTDHPGFVVTKVEGRRLTLEFRGGISAEYGKGERLRIYSLDGERDGGGAVITNIAARPSPQRWARRISGTRATLDAGASAEVGDLALWDVDECRIRGEVVHARQCDDLIGAVAILATLDRMAARGEPGRVIGLFTRAEEVGLVGAAAVAVAKSLPERALVVAVECSSMAGGRAEQGGGPIIRVGDLQHIFSSRMTLWMTQIAREMAEEDASFAYQRKLMDGGTTEATAYDFMGYETGAACVALGNYHNAGPRGRIAAETVHLGDIDGLAELFVRMARETKRIDSVYANAQKRWATIGREAAARLRRGS